MAKYPIQRVVSKAFTVPTRYRDVTSERLFSGTLPTRVIIGCVDNDAFNGNKAKNPFNFKNFDLTELSVYLDGQQQTDKYFLKMAGADKHSMIFAFDSGSPASGTDLLDITGRKVLSLVPGPNDIRHLSPGVYFVRTEDGEPVRKVVVQR